MTPARSDIAMTAPLQLCTFSVDGLLFGIDVMNVQEVIRHQEMTPVPLAPAAVRGLINLRGQIVTAIDMRTRLGLAPDVANASPVNVVIDTDQGVMSLLVDDIGEVLEVEREIFETAPEMMNAAFRELVPGVFKLEERLLLLLDVAKVGALGGERTAR